MPQPDRLTETISIELPQPLLERIRARVRSGEFDSESELIAHELDFEQSMHVLDEAWLEDAARTLERIDRGEEKTYTIEEVQQHLAERRAEFLAR